MLSIICFVISAAILIDSYLFKRDIFSPFRLYLFIHSLTFGIALLGFDEAMTPWQLKTKLIYFGSGFCFFCGTIAPHILLKIRKLKEMDIVEAGSYNWKMHFLFSFLLFIGFLVGIAIAYNHSGVFPLLSANPAQAINDFHSSAGGVSLILFNMGYLVFFMFFISAISAQKNRIYSFVTIFLCIFSFAVYLLTFVRNGIMSALFLSVVYYYYMKKKLSIGKLLLLGLFLTVIIAISSYHKFSSMENEYDIKISMEKVVKLALKIPYGYIANNYWNLDYALNPENYQQRHGSTYGFTLASSFFELFHLGGNWSAMIRESLHFEANSHVYSLKVKGWNTTGYQWNLYKDFGVMGTLFAPFIFGILISILYLKVRHQPTVFNVCLYANVAFNIFCSFGGIVWVESYYQFYGTLYLLLATFFCQYSKAIIEKLHDINIKPMWHGESHYAKS